MRSLISVLDAVLDAVLGVAALNCSIPAAASGFPCMERAVSGRIMLQAGGGAMDRAANGPRMHRAIKVGRPSRRGRSLEGGYKEGGSERAESASVEHMLLVLPNHHWRPHGVR